MHVVPSNFGIALKVLERVTDKLSLNNQLDQYNKVFLDQLEENVIEEFFVLPLNLINIFGYLTGLYLRKMNSPPLKCGLYSIAH